MSKKSHKGRFKRSISASKGWVTRRANAAHAARRAAALKGWETRRAKERSERAKKGWRTRRAKERSERAKKGWRTRRANQRKIAPRGAPQGGADEGEDYGYQQPPPRESVTRGEQAGGIYGGYEGSGEPEWQDFDDWDYDEFDEGLDAEADDDGDTGGESAKT